jgi:hypothetical protein
MSDDYKPGLIETLDHMDTMRRVVDLINTTSAYLDTEGDSPEEEALADPPAKVITAILDNRSKAVEVIMTLVAIIHDTGDEAKVQEWVNQQLGGALGHLATEAPKGPAS